MPRPLAVPPALVALLVLATACGAPAPEPPAGAGRLPGSGLVQPADLGGWMSRPDPPLLLDVRSRREFDSGHVEGAVHVPIDELARRLGELERGRTQGVIVYCESGGRSRQALRLLARAGFADTARLDGDMRRWRGERRPVVQSR